MAKQLFQNINLGYDKSEFAKGKFLSVVDLYAHTPALSLHKDNDYKSCTNNTRSTF